MTNTPALTPDELRRCLETLNLLGIADPEHPILRNRGYFALYLSGLSVGEVCGSDGNHPSVQEFRQIQRLLARAGVDRLKELLAAPPPPVSGETLTAEAPVTQATPPPPLMSLAPHLTDPNAPRSKYSGIKGIEPVRPGPEARERRKCIHAPDSNSAAREAAKGLLEKGHYHDAYNICADYLVHHGLDELVLETAAVIIQIASQYDRDKAQAPFNMLFECEELAHILARHVPDMTILSEHADEHTVRLYRSARLIYETWTRHACALLEYRYKTRNDQYMLRQWVEPRDVGFLRDIMLTGVKSRLPLDLLRIIYNGCRQCLEVVKKVIPFDNKRAKFEGDALRIVASPVKDVAPDMQLEIYKDIIKAYLEEGDTATANTFILQGLLIKKKDKDLLEMQEKVRGLIAQGSRSGEIRKPDF